jgi:hypothetical protein
MTSSLLPVPTVEDGMGEERLGSGLGFRSSA